MTERDRARIVADLLQQTAFERRAHVVLLVMAVVVQLVLAGTIVFRGLGPGTTAANLVPLGLGMFLPAGGIGYLTMQVLRVFSESLRFVDARPEREAQRDRA